MFLGQYFRPYSCVLPKITNTGTIFGYIITILYNNNIEREGNESKTN